MMLFLPLVLRSHTLTLTSVTQALTATHLAGRFIKPSVYLPLIQPYVDGDTAVMAGTSEMTARAAGLRLLAELLRGEFGRQR